MKYRSKRELKKAFGPYFDRGMYRDKGWMKTLRRCGEADATVNWLPEGGWEWVIYV